MKSSILNEKNTKYLIFESEESDFSDNTARGMLLKNNIEGVLPFTFSGFDRTQTLRYDISELKPVSELLEKCPDRESVFRIIKAAAGCCKEAEEYLIDRSSVVFSTDKVFISSDEKKIFFVILPFLNSKTPDIRDFIKTLLFSIDFKENENCFYIGKIINYLNKNEFEPEKLISLCESGYEPTDPEHDTQKTEHDCSSTVFAPENHKNDFHEAVPEKNHKNSKRINTEFSGEIKNSENTYGFKIPLDKYADEETVKKEKYGLFSRIFEKKNSFSGRKKCDEYGEIIDDNYSGDNSSFLLRVKNNEKITINKNIFRIGTDYNTVDYCIFDNNAVSRIHAAINKKNRQFFITDENSTNHTFINEQIIRNGVPAKIENRSKIRLGDEEFIFYCRQTSRS